MCRPGPEGGERPVSKKLAAALRELAEARAALAALQQEPKALWLDDKTSGGDPIDTSDLKASWGDPVPLTPEEARRISDTLITHGLHIELAGEVLKLRALASREDG